MRRLAAAVALATLSRQMEAEHPESNEGSRYFPVPLRDGLRLPPTLLRDWLDLFNHRFTYLFHRSWDKYRFFLAHT